MDLIYTVPGLAIVASYATNRVYIFAPTPAEAEASARDNLVEIQLKSFMETFNGFRELIAADAHKLSAYTVPSLIRNQADLPARLQPNRS